MTLWLLFMHVTTTVSSFSSSPKSLISLMMDCVCSEYRMRCDDAIVDVVDVDELELIRLCVCACSLLPCDGVVVVVSDLSKRP